MCLSCGCHKPEAGHGDDRHVTLSDLQAAADAAGISVVDAVNNIVDTVADVLSTDN
jgi:hypothetical protein